MKIAKKIVCMTCRYNFDTLYHNSGSIRDYAWIRNQNYFNAKNMKKTDGVTNFLGYKITSIPKDQLLKNLFSQVDSGEKLKTVFTPNPEQLVLAKSYSWFEKFLGKSDILLPDGMGIVIGSQILSAFGKGEPILQRIAGVDVVSELLANMPRKTILIIGGRNYSGCEYMDWKVVGPGSSKKTNKKNKVLYWNEAFLNAVQPTTQEKKQLESYCAAIKPDIVFVALGAPQQEKWVIENKAFLQSIGVKLVMAVGGSFDILFGKISRAPKWMQQIGLEWLFRLYKEPWRWRRQVNLLVFLKMVVQEALT